MSRVSAAESMDNVSAGVEAGSAGTRLRNDTLTERRREKGMFLVIFSRLYRSTASYDSKLSHVRPTTTVNCAPPVDALMVHRGGDEKGTRRRET